MANPVLVEVTRGGRVESRHRGAVAVVDADGKTALCAGRRRGAGLSALGGEGDPGAAAGRKRSGGRLRLRRPRTGAGAGLAWRRAGACRRRRGHARGHRSRRDGARMRHARAVALKSGGGARSARGEAPGRSTTTAPASTRTSWRWRGISAIDHRGYVAPEHPVQQAVGEALASLTGAPHGAENCGVDGCSIPTYAVPLASLARGFARFAAGVGHVARRARRRRGASTRRRSPSPSTSPARGASAPR